MKHLTTLLLALFFVSASWAQDADVADEAEETEAEAAEITAVAEEDEEGDDSELDEQGYGLDEEEDDFIPSQEVSADQSLAFPVDI